MAKTILIASNLDSPDCQLLRSICTRVRSLVQNTVSGYYGDALMRLGRSDELDSLDLGFILLGLSHASRQKDTPEFDVEVRVLKRALKDDIPIGIICDASGNITAPHITGGVLELVKLVGTSKVEASCAPSEIYPNAHLVLHPALEITVEAADRIALIMTPRSVPKSEGLAPDRRQQAAAGGWHNAQLGD